MCIVNVLQGFLVPSEQNLRLNSGLCIALNIRRCPIVFVNDDVSEPCDPLLVRNSKFFDVWLNFGVYVPSMRRSRISR